LGAEFIKQASSKTDDDVGDGTTTAIVLAHSIINEGEKAVIQKGFNVIRLAEALQEGSKKIIEELEKQRVLIESNKDIEEVATLSAKDKSVGELIAKVMDKVGRDGVVTVEDSNIVSNSYEIVEGLQFDRGYISPYMITNAERMEAVLEDPYILVTDKKISSIQELVPILEKIVQSGKKDLAIIADDVDGEALATLIVNKIRGILNVLAVKAPGFGDRRKEMLEDIAIVTGAEFISEDLGKKLESVDISSLGRAHRVISNKDNTTIVDGKGDKERINERIAQIKTQIKKTDSEFDKEKLQERLGKLSGGVAVIKVGAPTETAQKELKQRVEDAVNATKAAMEEGIIPGGGIGLFNVYKEIGEKPKYDDPVMEAALNILIKATEAPFEAIVINSGKDPILIKEELLKQREKSHDKWLGFNAVTNEIQNLKEAGVIDPLKVTKTAFMNAVSVASTYLTIGAAIASIPEKKDSEGNHHHGSMMEDY
jgi:chaperonin GroEL